MPEMSERSPAFSVDTPKSLGYRWPAEWEPHVATWLSWPHNRNSWPGKFEPVPEVFAQFALAVAAFEPVHILASGEARRDAEHWVNDHPQITVHDVPTNDCWIRDHGPWFLSHPTAPAALVDWEYNAWGGKYPPFHDDNAVPGQIAEFLQQKRFQPGLIMEGGSVENNGDGTLLVTAQCLLNPNRNPGRSQAEISTVLCEFSGAEQVLWLFDPEEGSLDGDDTDAHIDQLARFVSANQIVAAWEEPARETASATQNQKLLGRLHRELADLRDRHGKPFEIVKLPMPEPVIYEENVLPACYANFYVGNQFVIVPTFQCPQDDQAIQILKDLFPARQVIGINAVDLVWGLGAFHCASMQQGQSR